jgi:shikimate dehydrogenase
MKKFGILAYPAAHSRSPEIHNAVFRELRMDAEYLRFEISPENISSFFASQVRSGKIQGLSVSIPYKERVMDFLDEIDEGAQKIGSVNTIFWKNGKLFGTNTDAEGFCESLEEFISPQGKNILVCGAGGSARAVIYSLQKSEAKSITLWNRTPEKGQILAEEFELRSASSFLNIDPNKIDILVNATSLGMKGEMEGLSPVPPDFWRKHHIAFDLVYTPKETRFLLDAQKAGAFPISGDRMLLFQAVLQSKLFTGGAESLKYMEKALFPNQTMLDKILFYKQFDIWKTKKDMSTTHVYVVKDDDFIFRKTLQKKNSSPLLIAEIKPISPSKGRLFLHDETVESVASLYEENGAGAISVLTDKKFFGGALENLKRVRKTVSLPILRKDFIMDSVQVYEAKEYGANAVLLMRSVLSAKKIEEMLFLCRKLGMDALVEVHDEKELDDVLTNTSAKIIGINSRDLKTMRIDPQTFIRLTSLFASKLKGKLLVAESGISSRQDIVQFAKGADAILVGSGILEAENRAQKVRELSQS